MAAPPRTGRPSPAERRRRRTRTLALVVAIALVATLAVPLVALASPARSAHPGTAAAPTSDAEDARSVLGTADVHEVWLWSTAYLRGDEAGLAGPLDSAEQWVAGTADGTRTAWRDPEQDRVVEAGWDDDVELARALEGLAADDRLVTDEGDWLVVGADGTVRGLLPERVGDGPAEPTSLADFQTLRTARWEAALAGDGLTDGMAGGTGGPDATADDDGAAGQGGLRSAVPVAVVVAMLLTGTALAVRARRERDRTVRDGGDGPQAAVGSASPRSS